ncbi:MAG TPA: UvrD-helicase domain-containing protein [Candidatus Paceibacterota bacterium]
MKHLEGLNESQKEAVLHTEGPLLVLAGAGAGKTRVITCRIVETVRRGTPPQEILAVTFTNKAAREMRERSLTLLGESGPTRFVYGEGPFISTFHSLGLHIIKDNAKLLGLPRAPSIFDRSDSMRTLKEAMKACDLSPQEIEPRRILHAISREKGEGRTLASYKSAVENDGFFPSIIARAWEKYEAILTEEKALDFDDLLLKATELLRHNKEVRESYGRRWTHMSVDEYQDVNRVQNELAELLLSPSKNICAVGDIDQNIYSWRGAELKNILSFEKRFGTEGGDARIIILEENYRSTRRILEAANEIIRKNKYRKEKNLYTRNAEGDKLSLYVAHDETDEAGFVARKAGELIEEGIPAREIAVLFRTNFQSRALEEAFLASGIPYQVLGVRFFERKEVKDILSFIRASLPESPLADIKRVINVPPRGLGKVSVLKILAGRESELSGAARKSVVEFRAILARIQESALSRKPSETVRLVLEASGLETLLKAGDSEDHERLENMRELVSLATRYDGFPPREGIEALLEDAALATDQDELKEDRDTVKLMTVHAAKGLEFSRVFITGLEEGLFPHQSDEGDSEEEKEEERRLFYVALTRAKRKVYMCYASLRTIFGSRNITVPSPFIMDIPEELLENESPERLSRVIYLD